VVLSSSYVYLIHFTQAGQKKGQTPFRKNGSFANVPFSGLEGSEARN
jgi:hypothetical protein